MSTAIKSPNPEPAHHYIVRRTVEACRLAKEAVDILATASGGSSIYSDQPIQRIARDVNAVTMHALMHPDTNAELHGRILCGLDPDTLYI